MVGSDWCGRRGMALGAPARWLQRRLTMCSAQAHFCSSRMMGHGFMQSSAQPTTVNASASSPSTASYRAQATPPACSFPWTWLRASVSSCLLWLALSLGCGTADGSTVTLVWEPSGGATAYRVWSAVGTSGFVPSPTPVTATSATVPGDTAARFFVTALNSQGSESLPSSVLTYTPGATNPPPSVPAAPTGLTAQRINGNRVDATWTTSPAYESHVELSLNGGAFSEVAVVARGTMHTSLQVQKKASYALRVRAFDGLQFSGYSGTFYGR